MPDTVSRGLAVKKIEEQLRNPVNPTKNVWSSQYGRLELRELLDFIYGGPPACAEEEISSKKEVLKSTRGRYEHE